MVVLKLMPHINTNKLSFSPSGDYVKIGGNGLCQGYLIRDDDKLQWLVCMGLNSIVRNIFVYLFRMIWLSGNHLLFDVCLGGCVAINCEREYWVGKCRGAFVWKFQNLYNWICMGWIRLLFHSIIINPAMLCEIYQSY